MATATIVRAWTDTANAYLAVNVAESGAQGAVEYIGSVSLTADLASVGFAGKTWSALTAAEKKAALTAAVKAVRDAQQNAPAALGGLSGSVTI